MAEKNEGSTGRLPRYMAVSHGWTYRFLDRAELEKWLERFSDPVDVYELVPIPVRKVVEETERTKTTRYVLA